MPALPPSHPLINCVGLGGMEYADSRVPAHNGVTDQVSNPSCPATADTFRGWAGAPVQCGDATGFCNPFDIHPFGATYYDSGITPWGFWLGFGGAHTSIGCANDGIHALTLPPQWRCDPVTGIQVTPGQCCVCPDPYRWDYTSRTCLLAPCPADHPYWCEFSQSCVQASALCAGQLHCLWNPNSCQFDCNPPPDCGTGFWYNPASCSCEPCPPCAAGLEAHWCAARKLCICVARPDCFTQLHCSYSDASCAYLCDDPNRRGYCPPGKIWNQKKCRCEGECPAGLCWCDPTQSCIPCPDPPCAKQLHCTWDSDLCGDLCDDPATVCGPLRTWDSTKCRCSNNRPACLHDRTGRYWQASLTADGVRIRREDATGGGFILDATVTQTSQKDRGIAIASEEWASRLLLAYSDGSKSWLQTSNDDGATWEDPELQMNGVLPVVRVSWPAQCRIYASQQSDGTVQGTERFPGDLQASAPWTFQLYDAATNQTKALQIDANAGFDLFPEYGGAQEWSMACTLLNDTKESTLRSQDDCRTWEVVATG